MDRMLERDIHTNAKLKLAAKHGMASIDGGAARRGNKAGSASP